MTSSHTLVELLARRSAAHPARPALSFLAEGEQVAESLTYGDLDRRARALAVRLLAQAAPGDRALLLHPAGTEFVVAFLGCLYAGVVAVAAYPPRNPRHMARIEAILQDADARVILTVDETRGKILAWLGPRAPHYRVIGSEIMAEAATGDWTPPAIGPDSLALLQYSSGSTGTPRGVMISHANIMANERMICRALGYHEESSIVSWLPVYHDMGLFGNVLLALYLGTQATLMSPAAFLQKPVRWLSAVSRFRARTTGGPNFAFDLCARVVTEEQKAGLDLSCLDHLYSGSEPIDAQAMERFAAAFAPCGLRRTALVASYGMAECTLVATTGAPATEPEFLALDADRLAHHEAVPAAAGTRRQVVVASCGRSVEGQDLRIVDPATALELPEGRVGEIWLRGPHVALGYWRNAEDTRRLMRARCGGGREEYLRTGDLGFLRAGALHVTGRIKDVVIIRGRNHYPQDLERTAEQSHPALQPGSCAAFGWTVDGVERLGIAAEVKRTALRDLDGAAVSAALRGAVVDAHEVAVAAVALLKPMTLAKTSSGKIQRYAVREAFLQGGLDAVHRWRDPSLDPASAASAQRAAGLLGWLRDYAETRIHSFLMDERRSIPPHLVLDLGNAGVLGLQAPAEVGGAGLTTRDTLRVLAQLAAIDTNLSSFVGVHNALGLRPVLRYGSAAMRAEIVPRIAAGRELACFAFTEPGAGSNPRAIAARAVPDGPAAWRLHGTKKWIGTAGWAGFVTVFVHLLDEAGADRGITAFLLRQGSPGLRQGAEELTMGMRGMVQNTVHLEGVRATAADMLGAPGEGMVIAQDIMKFGRLAIAAASLGAMQRAVQLMLRYATRRRVATGRLLDNVIVRDRLTGATTRIAAVERLVGRFGEWLDAGIEVPEEMYALAKIAGPESLGLVVDHLMQLLGGRGYIETNGVPQMLRDVRLLRIFEGPTETMLMFLGTRLANDSRPLGEFLRNVLGAPALAAEFAECAAAAKQAHWVQGESPERTLGLQRVSQRLGDFGVWALWLAVLEPDADEVAPPLQRARLWLAREKAVSRARLIAPVPPEEAPAAPDELVALAAAYRDAIGDVEQQAAGVEYALDPDLRRATADTPAPADREPASFRYLAPATAVTPPTSATGGAAASGPRRRIAPAGEIAQWLRRWISTRLAVPIGQIDASRPFAELGLDSLTAVELATAVADWLQTPLPTTLTWDFPNIEALAAHLAAPAPSPNADARAGDDDDDDDRQRLQREVDDVPADELAALLSAELASSAAHKNGSASPSP